MKILPPGLAPILAQARPSDFWSRLWCAAGSLDARPRRSFRINLERFAFTAGWIPRTHIWIQVPSNAAQAVAAARCWARLAAMDAFPDWHVRRVFLQRLHFVQLRGPNVSDRARHRAAARDADLHMSSSWGDIQQAQSGTDIVVLDQHWHAYEVEDSEIIAEHILSEFTKSICVPEDFYRALEFVLPVYHRNLLGNKDFCEKPGLDAFRKTDATEVLVPLDRDLRRMVLMQCTAYRNRVITNFAVDAQNYYVDENKNFNSVLQWHEQKLLDLVPVRFRQKGPVQQSQIPHPFLLVKGKCVSTGGVH